MKLGKLTVTMAIAGFSLAACVSTTTGTSPPEADNDAAAKLNYQLGERYYAKGSYGLARDRLLLATELNPNHAVAYSTLAMTYEALDNLRLATNAYESAVRAEPRNFYVNNRYAVFLCKHKDYAKARKYFDKAINHPENDDAEVTTTNAGICMTQQPNMALAEEYFRAALDIKPAYGDALLQLCLIKYQEKDYLSARAFLQRYIASNPTTAGVLYLAARIEDMLDNDRGRTEYEDQLIREFPTSPEARKVLGAG